METCDKNARECDNIYQTDSDDDIESYDKFKEIELKESSISFPTVTYNADGRNISLSEIVNVSMGEDQISVSFTLEPNWEAIAFPKDYSIGRKHFSGIPVTPSKYVHARLKCDDGRSAASRQNIFDAFDRLNHSWMERSDVASSVH